MRSFPIIALLIMFASSCGLKLEGDVSASLNFIKNDFKPFSRLNAQPTDLIQNLTPHTITIKDIKKSHLTPSLEENGFQFEDFSTIPAVLSLLDTVQATVHNKLIAEERKKSLKLATRAFEEHIKSWANAKIPAFDEVICGTGYYRNTDAYRRVVANGSAQLEIAHIDFYPNQAIDNLLMLVGFNDDLVERFGNKALQPAFWHDHKIEKMVNVWMPMSKVTAYPLAVLDSKTIDFEHDIIPNLSNIEGVVGEFQSGALRYKESLRFYYKSGLDRGEAIIFDSFKTPHTAFSIPKQTDDRESYDVRCAFIKRLVR